MIKAIVTARGGRGTPVASATGSQSRPDFVQSTEKHRAAEAADQAEHSAVLGWKTCQQCVADRL